MTLIRQVMALIQIIIPIIRKASSRVFNSCFHRLIKITNKNKNDNPNIDLIFLFLLGNIFSTN